MDFISSNALPLSLCLGFIMPFIVSFIKKETWSVKVKHGVSIAVAFVLAIVTTVVTGGAHVTTWAEFATTFGVIFALANVLYTQWFKDTAFEQFFAKRGGIGDQTVTDVVQEAVAVVATDGGAPTVSGGGGV